MRVFCINVSTSLPMILFRRLLQYLSRFIGSLLVNSKNRITIEKLKRLEESLSTTRKGIVFCHFLYIVTFLPLPSFVLYSSFTSGKIHRHTEFFGANNTVPRSCRADNTDNVSHRFITFYHDGQPFMVEQDWPHSDRSATVAQNKQQVLALLNRHESYS